MACRSTTAFVSGSGRNIGRAIAIRLAQQGLNVVINGAKNQQACEATAAFCRDAGADVLVAMGDVGRPDELRNVLDAGLAKFGTVDVLVNNAAIRPLKPFLETSPSEWTGVIETNLYSAFQACQAFLPGMVERGWGRVINFAGMNAIRGYADGGSANSASKHALWGLTKSLAREFGPQGITVNIVSPGPIQRDDGRAGSRHHAPERDGAIPVGRPGQPQEVAALVAFLCSEEAAFITGQMLACNGGLET